jgi:hypothetical protein
VVLWLNGASTLTHRAEPGAWGTCFDIFDLPAAGAAVQVWLQLGLANGGTRAGNAGDFDDVGAYLFNSRVTARAFADAYVGLPPGETLLAEDARAAAEGAPVAAAPAAIPDAATPAGKNFLEAKAVYDRLEPGMSIHQAAEIVGMDANTTGWGKDYGRSMTPECVTLTVRFADGKVAWAALSRDYEEGNHASPGRILAEKGARPQP